MKKGDSDDYWKIEVVENTLTGDLKLGIQDFITRYVKEDLQNYPLEDEDVAYDESENRKALQDNERDIGRKLRNALVKEDKFMNVIIGNSFSVRMLKQYPHADIKVGPLRVFVFKAIRNMS